MGSTSSTRLWLGAISPLARLLTVSGALILPSMPAVPQPPRSRWVIAISWILHSWLIASCQSCHMLYMSTIHLSLCCLLSSTNSSYFCLARTSYSSTRTSRRQIRSSHRLQQRPCMEGRCFPFELQISSASMIGQRGASSAALTSLSRTSTGLTAASLSALSAMHPFIS